MGGLTAALETIFKHKLIIYTKTEGFEMPATCKEIILKGDPKNPESAEYSIIFPGGSIAVCRTLNNEYWAHIDVYKGPIIGEAVMESNNGVIIDSRLDYNDSCKKIDNIDGLDHISVRIKTKG